LIISQSHRVTQLQYYRMKNRYIAYGN